MLSPCLSGTLDSSSQVSGPSSSSSVCSLAPSLFRPTSAGKQGFFSSSVTWRTHLKCQALQCFHPVGLKEPSGLQHLSIYTWSSHHQFALVPLRNALECQFPVFNISESFSCLCMSSLWLAKTSLSSREVSDQSAQSQRPPRALLWGSSSPAFNFHLSLNWTPSYMNWPSQSKCCGGVTDPLIFDFLRRLQRTWCSDARLPDRSRRLSTTAWCWGGPTGIMWWQAVEALFFPDSARWIHYCVFTVNFETDIAFAA